MSCEPSMIADFRKAVEDGRGITVVGRVKGLGIRPTLLCVNSAGQSVYRLSVKQIQKVLKVWDSEVLS